MELQITVRFATNRYHGLTSEREVEWPPSPLRLFQAFVASSYRGVYRFTHPNERDAALEWFEGLEPPIIEAKESIKTGENLTNYVPNNDNDLVHIRTEKSMKCQLMPSMFPIMYRWKIGNEETAMKNANVICKMANLVTHLGQHQDLVLVHGETVKENGISISKDNVIVYQPIKNDYGSCPTPAKGTFKSLRERYDNVQKGGSPIDYEIVCRYVNYIGSDVITIDVPIALFEMETEDGNWQKFEPCDLRIPSGMVRNAAIQFIKENQSFNELYGADMVSRLVAGHEGSQTNDKYNGKHIAFVPLPSLNRSGNADGWIRRVLMVGYGCETEDARKLFDDLTSALHGRAIYDNKKQIGVLRRTKSEDKDNVLRLFIGKDKRYKVWRTVTPIVLTGMMRRGRSVEDLVVRALKQSGIEPEYVDSIATFRGPIVPKTFHALDYHVRGYLEKTGRFHAEIIFKKPVIGPLILGRGRYSGFGLMMAWAESPPKDLQ